MCVALSRTDIRTHSLAFYLLSLHVQDHELGTLTDARRPSRRLPFVLYNRLPQAQTFFWTLPTVGV